MIGYAVSRGGNYPHSEVYDLSHTQRGHEGGWGGGGVMVANGCNGFRSCWLELYRGMYRVDGEELRSV